MDVGAPRGGTLNALRMCGRALRARPHTRKAFRLPPPTAPTSNSPRARLARPGPLRKGTLTLTPNRTIILTLTHTHTNPKIRTLTLTLTLILTRTRTPASTLTLSPKP